MGIGAAIAGVASIGGALISSNASSDAANAATQASASNNATTLGIYNQNKANSQGFINNGLSASNQQAALLGLGGDSTAANNAFTKYLGSSGYNFQLNQGLNAVNNNYATRGALDSGAAVKALNDYAQGQASNSFQTYLGNLGNVSNSGLAATNALAGVGTNVSNQIASNNNNAATAQGNAAIAQGNAFNTGLGGIVKAVTGSSYGGGGGGGNWTTAASTDTAALGY